MPRESMPDVIVLLPGIAGSVLRKDGKEVWALSGEALQEALRSLGRSLKDLTLAEDPPDREDLGDGVTADRLIGDVHLIPYLWKIDGYSKVAETIKTTFDVQLGRNYFEFPYDWRRDNRVAANRLDRASKTWLANWRTSSGKADARLILIAHSMGGLVSRYFIEVLKGWKDTRALITFGTPYRGSVNALEILANGFRKGPAGLLDLSALVRSLTSVYQLLPTYRCFDPGNGTLVRVGETSDVPNLDSQKAAAALAFHREIEQAVEARRRQDAKAYEIYPIVGIEQPTSQSARRAGGGVEILTTHEGKDLKGDGTVPRVSATPLELSEEHREMFAATRHASLQNADAILTNLHGVISNLYLDLGAFKAPPAPPRVHLGLEIEDAYWHDEPVAVRVLPDAAGVTLHGVIAEAKTGAEVDRQPLRVHDGRWQSAEFRPIPAGTYRMTVAGDAGVEPVQDVFAVFDRTM